MEQPILDLAAQLTGLIVCTLIVWRTEPAINRMGNDSPPMLVRIAFALLATGAVGGILVIFGGNVPELHTLILTAGTAALTFCERRIRLLTGRRHPSPRKGLNHAQR